MTLAATADDGESASPVRTDAMLLADLHEVVAAIDRRRPQRGRQGEQLIAGEAARIRATALRRITQLQRSSPATADLPKNPVL